MLVAAASFPNIMAAGVAQSALTAAGIESMLFDTDMSWDGMGIAIPIRLMVLDEDLADAQAALSAG